MSQAWNWDMEKMMGLCVAMVIVNFGSDTGKWADELDISSVHVQWFSHWKSSADNHDIILWHHKDLSCYWGGNYIRKQAQASGLLSGFWNWMVGSIATESLTLYFGYIGASHEAGV